jgi:DNA replication and repair protein RecF
MISDIRLQSYRSYGEATFEFGTGVNIIVGANASGKTNLLEAILVVCRGSSYRAKDIDLIAFQAPWSRLDASTHDGVRSVIVERKNQTVEKKYIIQSVSLKRLLMNKTIPVVVFEPDHLRLLSGGPERRREYIDGILEQTISGFSKLRRDYKRTLAQRNRLLKNIHVGPDEMFVWNVRLSELAGKIVSYRKVLIDTLQSDIQAIYQSLSQTKTEIDIQYSSHCNILNYSTDLLKHLEQGLNEDIQRGFTSYGPHRDDIIVTIDSHPAAVSASRGESRTILLALKILELKIIEKNRGKKPLFLLDDVFSELDGSRRKALTNYLQNYQTFITTTDADIVLNHFMEKCRIIPITS